MVLLAKKGGTAKGCRSGQLPPKNEIGQQEHGRTFSLMSRRATRAGATTWWAPCRALYSFTGRSRGLTRTQRKRLPTQAIGF